MKTLTTEQLGKLLYKADHEPRRNQKRYLKDLGGEGSADELDQMLAIAEQSAAAKREAKRLERERAITAKTIETGIDGHVAEMLAAVRLRLDELEMTQAQLADLCGWPASQLSAYLSGTKSPGVENLARMATALNAEWRLTPRAK